MNAKVDSIKVFATVPLTKDAVACVPVRPKQVAVPCLPGFREEDKGRRGLRPCHTRTALPARSLTRLSERRLLSVEAPLFQAFPSPAGAGMDFWETLSYLALEGCVLVGIALCFL